MKFKLITSSSEDIVNEDVNAIMESAREVHQTKFETVFDKSVNRLVYSVYIVYSERRPGQSVAG